MVTSPKRQRAPRAAADTIVGRLKAADPFELIRWLARSQPDPRKALAELVQNSIDARARRIEITRARERGVLTLRVLDDGEGVIPELARREALTYIATHVGHSRKRNLTPEQRRELMTQGKYGIGLLGFWAIGRQLEIRSHLPGEPSWLLRLHEESPRYELERVRGRLPLDGRSTEVVVQGLHRAGAVSLTARRMADFLAAELRGQILAHQVDIVVHDRVARGRAPKVLPVRPARYLGEPLALPEEIVCPGYSPLRLELHLLPEPDPEHGRVAISSGGTMVYDDVADLEVMDFRRVPWTDRRLTGVAEFADFQVPPGTRRGVVPDQAALAFAEALRDVEPAIRDQLRAEQERAAAAIEADLLRQLERAFREVPKLAPEYDFFAVRAEAVGRAAAAPPETAVAATGVGGAAAPGAGGGASGTPAPAVELSAEVPSAGAPSGVALSGADEAEIALVGAAVAEEGEEPDAGPVELPRLFPAGPLRELKIVPADTRVEPRGQRRLRAEARDAQGDRIRREIEIAWSVSPELGTLVPATGARTVFCAGEETGPVEVLAQAREGERTATATARIEIAEAGGASPGPRTGIPEPLFVHEPAGGWRSRMADGRWEVNSGHPDFRAASEGSRRKLRYLAALLAKEVVLHSFPSPQLAPALERLVEILTIAERGLERG